MACVLVPATAAVVTTVATAVIRRRQKKIDAGKISLDGEKLRNGADKFPFVRKLQWLSNLLWGGALLLIFEHIWHGEIIAQFPFLTAASDPGERAVMLREMATVGVGMTVLVTLVWLAMVAVTARVERRARRENEAAQ